jgi:O-antigen/teichoic acid export membrane protein
MAGVIGQFFKNVVTTWANMVITLVVTFFFTPYLIEMLGKERYGIWNLAFSVIAYLGLADLGMKQSVVRYISKYLATRDWKQLNEVYSSAIKLYSLIALLIAAVAVTAALFFLRYFQIPSEYVSIARVIILTLGLNEAITYAFLPQQSLGAYHRFDITAYFKIGRLILQTLGIIVLLESGFGLISMAMIVVFLNICFIVCLNAIRRRLFPQNRFSVKDINPEKTKMLLHYGLYSFLIVAAWIIIFQSDNIIIGSFLSMEAVAYYSVAGMIITQIRGAMQIIAVPLVPAISHLEAEKDYKKIISIYQKSTRYMYYISGFMAAVILLYGGPFINLWIDQDFSVTINVLKILAVAAAIFLPQTVANSVLFGVSKHRIAFYVLLSEAVAKITLSIILVHYMGIIGVAVGTAIPQLIIYIFIYPIVFHRAMSARPGPFYKTALVSIVWSVIFTLPVGYLLSLVARPDSWFNLFFNGLAVGLVALIGLVIFILEKDDRDRMIGKLVRRFARN